jgi:hypothetical protein
MVAEREVSREKKGKGAAKYESKWVEKDEGAAEGEWAEKGGGPTERKGSGKGEYLGKFTVCSNFFK